MLVAPPSVSTPAGVGGSLRNEYGYAGILTPSALPFRRRLLFEGVPEGGLDLGVEERERDEVDFLGVEDRDLAGLAEIRMRGEKRRVGG